MYSPKVGDRFNFYGSEYEIAFVDGRQIRYALVKGGKMSKISVEKLQELIQLKKAKITLSQTEDSDDLMFDALLKNNDKETETIKYRLKYVRGIISKTKSARSKNIVSPLIAEISKNLGDVDPPSFSTVARWMKSYIESNYNPLSLLSFHKRKGNRTLRFEPGVEQIIIEQIKEDYLSKNRLSKTKVAENIRGRMISEYSIGNISTSEIEVPSDRTIQRRIDEMDPYELVKHRHGKYIADKEFKAAGKSIHVERCLERVEADGHHLDLLLIDEDTEEVIGRAYCTVMIDVYSRCILSFVISLIPFSSVTILQALSEAICTPRSLPGGLPERLIFDNGSDYISNSIRNMCNKLGVTIEYAPPRNPNTKAHVERFFRTLNSQLVHLIPGTTFSNPKMRGDYESEKFACATKSKAIELVNEWIEIYHKSIHRGTSRAPIAIWKESMSTREPFTFKRDDLEIIARSVDERRISRGRIRIHNLQWYSHALSTLEYSLRKKNIKPLVTIYINELDLSSIYVEDPFESGNFIKADSVKPKYANGLSLYEHNLIRSELKIKTIKDMDRINETELLIAKWNLYQKIVEMGSKHADRQIARINNSEKKIDRQGIKRLEKLEKENSNPLDEGRESRIIDLVINDSENSSDDDIDFGYEEF